MTKFKIFSPFNYEKEYCSCHQCDWVGDGAGLEIGEVFDSLYEVECPRCHARIGCVPYPTIAEARENWSDLSEVQKNQVKIIEMMGLKFDQLSLKSPDQLPEIAAHDFVLIWDLDDTQQNMIIKYDGAIIFSEPSGFEDYERFRVVIDILKLRYGSSLRGVHPTLGAWVTLCGDKWLGSQLQIFHKDAFGIEFPSPSSTA